ncbi:werner syndrome-like exonuclease [Quercus suber]|uniref:Werner syndrome-like exonuclease n=1 Tax=Quercus suber TaxID=58331 RepID=A0AAW0MDU8_QUESU
MRRELGHVGVLCAMKNSNLGCGEALAVTYQLYQPTGVAGDEVNQDTHDLFEVTFVSNHIQTLVYRIHRRRLHRLIVGLDVEWQPSFNHNIKNPVATLQLCMGRRRLIFQFIYATHFPSSLIEFLGDKDFTFVGVGIESDVEKLLDDYDLKVGNVVNLRGLVDRLGNRDLKNAGLKGLARAMLGLEVHKPRHVTLSSWRSMEVER